MRVLPPAGVSSSSPSAGEGIGACSSGKGGGVAESIEHFYKLVKDGFKPFVEFEVPAELLCPDMYAGLNCDCKKFIHIKRCTKRNCKPGCTFLHVWNMPSAEARQVYRSGV
jgi:hypothetical protein